MSMSCTPATSPFFRRPAPTKRRPSRREPPHAPSARTSTRRIWTRSQGPVTSSTKTSASSASEPRRINVTRGLWSPRVTWMNQLPFALSLSGHRRDFGQLLDGGIDARLGKLDILELAGEVRVVRRHVEVAVSGQAEQDDALVARLPSGRRLLGHRAQRMGGLGRGQEALGACELHSFGEDFVLLVGTSLADLAVDQRTQRRRVSVIAQAACVNPVWNEAVAERVHLHDRAHAHGVAEVEGIDAASERWTRGGLGRDEARLWHASLQSVADEWIAEAGEVGPAADAADHDVRILACHLHLLLGLEPDDRLVEQDVVYHRAQRVLGVVVRG